MYLSLQSLHIPSETWANPAGFRDGYTEMVVTRESSSANSVRSVGEGDLPNWYTLRQEVGLGVNHRISLQEAREAHVFDWQLPLTLQPLPL
jgi:hypothetical protein